MERQDVDICGCHWFIIDEDSKYIDCRIAPLTQSAICIQFTNTTSFAHGSVMVKKDIISKYMYGNTKYHSIE